MNLFKEHLKQSSSAEEGIKAYVADVTARYVPVSPMNGGKLVKCRWFVEYESKADMATTGCMLPLLFLGLFHYARSKIVFDTYHLLTAEEAKQLQRGNGLRKLFLPFSLFGVLASGFILLSVGGLSVAAICMVLNGAPQTGPAGRHPWGFIMGLFACGLIFAASLKLQLYLRKTGRPPHTEEFGDQHIKLQSVTVQ